VQYSHVTESPFPTRRPGAFRHDAVFYRGERGFLRAVLPFVAAAVARAEPVLVAVLPARKAALRSELGDAASGVEFVDMQSAGIRHGGGRGVLRSWQEHDAVVCELADAGELRDPLAGRSLPVPECSSGRGLWLISHLCDLVQIRTTESGTVVRLRQQTHRAP
jgi:hypothetical protein